MQKIADNMQKIADNMQKIADNMHCPIALTSSFARRTSGIF